KGKGKRKWTKPLIILGGIILGIVLLGVSCNPIGGGPIPPGGDLNEDHIAVLHVEGVISAESTGSLMGGSNSYNHEFLLSTIEEAKHNDQ
ncbi:MAG: hypothetical protein RR472_07060, partial [Anaerovoracaceae bacterium]